MCEQLGLCKKNLELEGILYRAEVIIEEEEKEEEEGVVTSLPKP